jgi:type IV secretory pathway TrbD component
VPGFTVPVHRALTEHILLGGAPRSIAILNGTLAGAVGLGLRLWLVGLADLGHRPFRGRLGGQARSALRRGRRRHLRIPGICRSEEARP